LGFVPGGRDGGGGVEERARVAVVGAVLISEREAPNDGGQGDVESSGEPLLDLVCFSDV
jgi:hypothetical protein